MLDEFSQSSALIEVAGNRSEEGGVLLSVTEACTGGKVAYLMKRKKETKQDRTCYMIQNLLNVSVKIEPKTKESEIL